MIHHLLTLQRLAFTSGAIPISTGPLNVFTFATATKLCCICNFERSVVRERDCLFQKMHTQRLKSSVKTGYDISKGESRN